MRTFIRLGAALAIGATLVACSGLPNGNGGGGSGSDDGGGGAATDGSGGDGSGTGTGMGPGLTIDEAIRSTAGGPLLVNGYLVINNLGEMRLCSALAESYPPQCGGESLRVRGLELATLDADMQSAERTTWSEDQIQVLGTVEDGTITVESNAMP